MCETYLDKRRAADRAKYAAGKAAGLLYGGANIETKRRIARAASKKRLKARREAGLCVHCGQRTPVERGAACQPCRDRRQAAERRKYAERRAARRCTRCGDLAFDDLSRCGPCAVAEIERRDRERKNACSRKLYRLAFLHGLELCRRYPQSSAMRIMTERTGMMRLTGCRFGEAVSLARRRAARCGRPRCVPVSAPRRRPGRLQPRDLLARGLCGREARQPAPA